jgi:hypothetical protein
LKGEVSDNKRRRGVRNRTLKKRNKIQKASLINSPRENPDRNGGMVVI